MAVNGLYIVQGELNCVVALLRKAHRNYAPAHIQVHEQPLFDDEEPLLRSFSDLRDVLNSVADLADISPSAFLGPFLDVVKSEVTNGPTTGQALSSVGKFLSYGLVDVSSITAASAVENIADAITHARFVGGNDAVGDEVVLLKILHVLRTLMLTPVGRLLSNESVCEIMQSGFRICFETRLSELLRKAAEATLADMVQLLFTRLPTFKEDTRHPYIRKLKMRASTAGGTDILRRYGKYTKKKKKPKRKTDETKEDSAGEDGNNDADVEDAEGVGSVPSVPVDPTPPVEHMTSEGSVPIEQTQSTTTDVPAAATDQSVEDTPAHVIDLHGSLGFQSEENIPQAAQNEAQQVQTPVTVETDAQPIVETGPVTTTTQLAPDEPLPEPVASNTATHLPYGLPCVREVLRFLVSLTSALDRQNTESMLSLGLNLMTIALEAGADHLGNYSLLMPLIENDLSRSLIVLLNTDKIQLFAAALRVGFLLMESLRMHLKLQLETYLKRLMELIVADHSRVSFEQKELALEALDQLWRIPGLVTELYLNYDCSLYCSNLFEDVVKLLSKNAFPVSSLCSTHILSLDALLTVIDAIDTNCHYRGIGITNQQSSMGDLNPSPQHNAQQSTLKSPQFELPAISGFEIGRKLNETVDQPQTDKPKTNTIESVPSSGDMPLPAHCTQFRANRQPLIEHNIPSRETLIDQKKRKRLLMAGTELFNQSPSKGIAFLHEHGLLDSHVPHEVVKWLKENPGLDKKKIADYIVSRKHAAVLEAFVNSFVFENVRLDDALRSFLETFRLPGEAAEISMVMTHFAEHWFKSNPNDEFANSDSAFTLSYAVIMLNTDQHNPQVRRNQPPMTVECFKRNTSGCNGGGDFDPELLEDIYKSIKEDEIVMPAEHTGLVKENYLWKTMLRRTHLADGQFIHAPSGYNDYDLFLILWGPTIAALSFVFDKSEHEHVLQKSLAGFRKCARISAHYGMSDVFDNLVISLCKFTQLMGLFTGDGHGLKLTDNAQTVANDPMRLEKGQEVAVAFGDKHKAQMAARALFSLIHDHGDILREGWKNLLDCMLTLWVCDLLPKSLTEVEDYVDGKGWVSIARQPTARPKEKVDTGLLSSFVYFLGGSSSDTREPRQPTNEEQQQLKVAHSVIQECHPEQLVIDSKYLTRSALSELIQAIVLSSAALTNNLQQGAVLNDQMEGAMVFYLELMISIALDNKDRLPFFWNTAKRHLATCLSSYPRNRQLVQRTVVGLLRVTNRNLFRLAEDMADEVVQSLSMLQSLSPSVGLSLSQQMSCGLHELLRANAANLHSKQHWTVLFALLEQAGAAAYLQCAHEQPESSVEPERHAHSDGDDSGRPASALGDYSSVGGSGNALHRGYTSDTELTTLAAQRGQLSGSGSHANSAQGSQEWIKLEHPNGTPVPVDAEYNSQLHRRFAFDRNSLVLRIGLHQHDPLAFLKCAQTVAFLVRDAAHITPENFDSCVRCLRTLVEASLDGGRYVQNTKESADPSDKSPKRGSRKMQLQRQEQRKGKGATKGTEEVEDTTPSPEQQLADNYHQVSLQLIDLCYTLHVKSQSIFESWATSQKEIDASAAHLWTSCWRPLLQALARSCTDCRRLVRAQAFNYFQRAFLIQELQVLGCAEWEDCFAEIVFPLLSKLAENISPMDPLGMEETRNRAVALLSKVLLNHLGPLSTLPTFRSIWLTVLDFMDRYLRTDRSELLSEAIPESLKNMLLILDNTGMFATIPGLYELTKERLSSFLPDLLERTLPEPPVFAPAETVAPVPVPVPAPEPASGPQTDTQKQGAEQPIADRVVVDEDMTGVVISKPVEQAISARTPSPPPATGPVPAAPVPAQTMDVAQPAPGNVPVNLRSQQMPSASALFTQPPASNPQHIILHPPAPQPQRMGLAPTAPANNEPDPDL